MMIQINKSNVLAKRKINLVVGTLLGQYTDVFVFFKTHADIIWRFSYILEILLK